ncbi:hypothetical protein BD289DRAFT_424722 [Coniella lustricola]|uniref:Secreted protein n=1 Tax=Coniella lustricola TaxID=2025994 RepID=A0A2T3AI84_9PEZI|nr:hypothetical protein BD289DRAFT_424722 [Coniella lustricola]
MRSPKIKVYNVILFMFQQLAVAHRVPPAQTMLQTIVRRVLRSGNFSVFCLVQDPSMAAAWYSYLAMTYCISSTRRKSTKFHPCNTRTPAKL